MAIKDKTTFTTAIQAFCDALNNAMKEDGGSGMASELLKPQTPLRQITKLFNMDEEGIVSEDNNYIDEAYDGNYPSKGNQLDKVI